MTSTGVGLFTLNLNVDADSLVSKIWDRFLSIFGADSGSREFKSWLEERTRSAFLQSRDVQIIGMHTPILLSEIYQPTRLQTAEPETISGFSGREWDAPKPQIFSVGQLLKSRTNSVITAGPGWGKTTLLRAMFVHCLVSNTKILPVLITLRQKEAIPDLQFLVTRLQKNKADDKQKRILLLIDGYDEISSDERKEVSSAIHKFSASAAGDYYLTCRDFYEIFDLIAPRLRIAEFTEEDQIKFVTAFLRAYGSPGSAADVVKDLHRRGLSDLLRHPLLLTLASIVKSSSIDVRTRNIVSLIEAAIQTLSLRWDQGKGLRREAVTPLDSSARVKILKRVAFSVDLEPAKQQRVIDITRKQLDRMSWDNVDALTVLYEIAQFYGILVPMGDRWGFVHRTLQDFLAAQYSVENGHFHQEAATGKLPVNSRTAFAASLIQDATTVMEHVLKSKEGLPFFSEMLMNGAAFDHPRIANLIIAFYENYKGEHYYRRIDGKLECNLREEFISDAGSKFLDYLIQVCGRRGKTTDTLAAYAIVELDRRKIALSNLAYKACMNNFRSPEFVLDVLTKNSHHRLADVRHD